MGIRKNFGKEKEIRDKNEKKGVF